MRIADLDSQGIHTRAHRHAGSSVYFCFDGEGSRILDGIEFRWSAGDSFVIPSWAIHEHQNASGRDRTLLVSLHDSPLILMKAVRKYREASFDDNGGPQVVHGRFQ